MLFGVGTQLCGQWRPNRITGGLYVHLSRMQGGTRAFISPVHVTRLIMSCFASLHQQWALVG